MENEHNDEEEEHRVDLALLKKKQIKAMIRETQKTLDELKAELKKRKTTKQHSGIDKMDKHFEKATGNLASLRKFLQRLKEDR